MTPFDILKQIQQADNQKMFRNILDTASDAIVTIDGEQRIVMFNLQAEQVFGLKASDVLGEPLSMLLPERFRRAHLGYIEHFADEPESRRLMGKRSELAALHSDGTEFPVEISISKVEMTDGDKLFTAIVRDVTERKEAEKALQRAHDELEHRVEERTAQLASANNELRKFAYIVSHDLRGPLVNLKGFAGELRFAIDELSELLEKCAFAEEDKATAHDLLEQDIPESLGFIEAASSRMDQLINAILKLSRIGHQKLFFQPVDLNAVFEDSVRSFAHQADQANVSVTVEPLPVVKADPTSISQVADNLMSNAIKYLVPERPGQIRVFAEPHEAGVTVHVEDNGRGIEEVDHEKVFQIFRRAGVQDTPGEGMGLNYVQAIVGRHGGSISLVSQPGEGSRFSITLPHHPEDGRET
ncbi:MAG: PAS domain-containing sensor histidine kinase [Deltaproteobacteria bacterium]|nr:MAG: PAS domain-containing sensor histidine kinase [Deltaproteobacteria bacterium]